MSAPLHPWSAGSPGTSARYWCSACRRWHDGEPDGVVADLLAYCQAAIRHYQSLNLIVGDEGPGPWRHFRLSKGFSIHPARPSQAERDEAVLDILRRQFGEDAVVSVRTYRNPMVAYVVFLVNDIECRASTSLTEGDSPEVIARLLARNLSMLLTPV